MISPDARCHERSSTEKTVEGQGRQLRQSIVVEGCAVRNKVTDTKVTERGGLSVRPSPEPYASLLRAGWSWGGEGMVNRILLERCDTYRTPVLWSIYGTPRYEVVRASLSYPNSALLDTLRCSTALSLRVCTSDNVVVNPSLPVSRASTACTAAAA